MKKALLLSFIFIAVFNSAFALIGNTTSYEVSADFVQASDIGNSIGHTIYWAITEQPIQIQGNINGTYSYVGFFPLLDNYTYFVPFLNGYFTFHCNPSDIKLDNSLICTGSLFDVNGTAVNNAHIDWELYNSSDVLITMGDFTFIGNGAYKFSIPITMAGNFTSGDYYLKFKSIGFGFDYTFPIHISTDFFTQNATMFFALTMIVLGTVMIIFGYWRRITNFVIFGAFTYIVIAMTMFLNPTQFGAIISNAFGVIFSLTGIVLLISMFLEKWREKKDEKEREQNGG